MADEIDAEAVAALRKKRQFKKFTFRGLELKQLLDLSKDELINILNARARRKLQRGTKPKHSALLEKLKKAKTGKLYIYCVLLHHLNLSIIDSCWSIGKA